jgi:glycosyltransferase involved in cell wall biosynthesis
MSSNQFARKILLVFVAQRPTLDPRVDWVASFASTEFEVTVHGLRFDTDTDLLLNEKNGYQIKRHPRIGSDTNLFRFVGHFVSAMPILHQCIAYLLAVVFLPFLLVGVLFRLSATYAKKLVRSVFPILIALEKSIPILGPPMRYGYRALQDARQQFLAIRRRLLSKFWPKSTWGVVSMLAGHMAPTADVFSAAIDKAERKPDVVHCCDLDTLLVGVIAKRKYGCTLIYDAHEYWAYTDPDWVGPVATFYRYLEQTLIRHADHVVTVSPSLASVMRVDYGLHRVHAVPNAAPWTKSPIKSPTGDITALAAGRKSFLFQGGIAQERGLEELLIAWCEVDPNKAALFIRGPDSIFKDALHQQAVASGLLGKSVYFLDSISEDFLIEAAREADVGLIPYKNTLINHKFACPNKLSQYMHAGLMLISSDIPYVAGVIKEARAGLSFESGSKDSLLTAINTAIADNGLLAECKKNAQIYAKETFNWDKFYPILRQLYDPALHGAEETRETVMDFAGIDHDQEATSQGNSKKTVLILYFTRGVYPLRSTIHSHLYCWRKYSKHRIVYVNVALGFPERLIKRLKIDVIIFHTMFMSMRWTPAIFKRYVSNCFYLKTLACTKIIVPQDEFLHTEMLTDFCIEFGVTHFLTNTKDQDWDYIYGRLDRNRVKLTTVLTGYLDPETLATIEDSKARHSKLRDIDIGYRAWKAEYWLGEHGLHKTRIASVFKFAANRAGLKSDISLEEKDVILGDAWFDYLIRCRATVGCEGGSRMLDRNGHIKDCVAAFLKSNPAATFEDTRSHCFPDEDGKVDLAVITPRHFEACATETLQFLVEGTYNGILIPWRHYVPIMKDYSNVEDALTIFNNPERMREIVSMAYKEIALGGKWTYPVFVKTVEDSIINTSLTISSQKNVLVQKTVQLALKLRDELNWYFIRTECWCVSRGLKTRIGRWIYARLIRLKGPY